MVVVGCQIQSEIAAGVALLVNASMSESTRPVWGIQGR